jgi:hypothetical protein
MAITDAQKTDYLFKKVGFSVSKTDVSTSKSPSNESVASPLVLRGDTIWQQSSMIPSVIPAANSSVITVYSDALTDTIKATVDGTATANRTWLTGLTNWIDPSFGSTYQVKVYVVESATTNPQTTGYQIPSDGSGNNDAWFFDYSSGVLNFPDTNLPYYANGVAVTFTGKSIFVTGARYTGQTGLTTFANNTTFTSNVTVNGNVTASYLTGNGSLLTGTYGNTQVAANLTVYTGNISAGNLNAIGNVTSTYYYGNGSLLTGLYGNTQAAAYLTVYNGNIAGGNLTTTGNVTASYYYGNGSALVGMYGNTQAAAYFNTFTGNISAGNVITTGAVIANTVNANVYTNYITAQGTNGNITLSPTGTGIVYISGTGALSVPVGTSGNYPSTPTSGMIRWNTTYNYLEVYTGSTWEAVGLEGTTVVTSDTFTGNGTKTQFTLSQNTTTQGSLVSINGVIQIPTTSYTVSGNVLTLNEAPLSTDIIEARTYTPAQQVTSLKNSGAQVVALMQGQQPNVQVLINSNPVLSADGINTAIVGNLVINGVKINYASTGYNVTKFTNFANLDNVSATTFSNGFPAISAVSGTLNAFWSASQNKVGQANVASVVNTGVALTAGTYGNIAVPYALGSGGDTVIAVVQDQDRNSVYRITWMQTVGSDNAAVVTERIM